MLFFLHPRQLVSSDFFFFLFIFSLRISENPKTFACCFSAFTFFLLPRFSIFRKFKNNELRIVMQSSSIAALDRIDFDFILLFSSPSRSQQRRLLNRAEADNEKKNVKNSSATGTRKAKNLEVFFYYFFNIPQQASS